MKEILKHRKWLLPVLAFCLPVGPALCDLYWWRCYGHYRKQGNASCALARGYARDFEEAKGHRPSMEELKPWAVEQFKSDLEKMEIRIENLWWIEPEEIPQPQSTR